MNWFGKKGDRLKGRPDSPFNYFLFLFLAFSAALVLMKTGSLQAVSTNAVQTNWAGGQLSNTTTDFSAWTYYLNADTGITVGTDIKLKSTNYTATDDGATSCTQDGSSTSCTTIGVTGGTFAAGTSTSTNTTVSGSVAKGLEVFYEV